MSDAFSALVATYGDDLPLDRAAALLAADEQPGVDPDAIVAALDELARGARLPRGVDAFQAVARLNHYLFEELGFDGDSDAYDDPVNSYLDQVLERRRGLPILLSLVYVEIARRRGVDIDPIGFPGHFIVSPRGSEPRFFVDPFRRGAIVRLDAALKDLEDKIGETGANAGFYLSPVSGRQVLIRMTVNLKGSWLRRGDHTAALRNVERLLVLVPEAVDERRDRGLLLARLGRDAEAITDLASYLGLRPNAPDARQIAATLAKLQAEPF
jgi:regulator of sirC expression with transglutaminase-like and TPR domain